MNLIISDITSLNRNVPNKQNFLMQEGTGYYCKWFTMKFQVFKNISFKGIEILD